jgi:protein O-mannosyl-transferase
MKINSRFVFTCIGLVAITLAAYWPACGDFDFVNFDDNDYVANSIVESPLSWGSVQEAFSSFVCGNWHPLVLLSLRLDIEMFGTGAPVHHRVNVALHAANVLLLFVAWWRMTGAVGRSAVVAALFGVHPLHVESVAWVTERKDVLSGLFWMLTLLAYAWYAARPRFRRYLVVLLAFALGLTAKGMLVTMPCVLCLLDYWPLQRLPWRQKSMPPPEAPAEGPHFPSVSLRQLLWEKLPLFLLVWLISEATLAVQQTPDLGELPLPRRLDNIFLAYVGYLVKAFWPSHLCVLYPYPKEASAWWTIALATLTLGGLTVFALRQSSRPYLLVGWLWYMGTLVPVIGLVHVGRQSMADRYTYIPLIGFSIAVVWGLAALAPSRRGKIVLAIVATAAVAGCAVSTWFQVQTWRNSETLWRHAIAVDPQLAFAHELLGMHLASNGRMDEAVREMRIAVELEPDSHECHFRLATLLRELGRIDEANAETVEGRRAWLKSAGLDK